MSKAMEQDPASPRVCAAHGPWMNSVQKSIEDLGKMLTIQIQSLREEMTRRMDESRDDRSDLHDAHNALAREVTATMTRLNGAKLIMVQPHHRDTDPDGARFPREPASAAAVSAFPIPPKPLLIGTVVLAIGFGIGLILLVQTKLDIDTIKAVQALRNPAPAASSGVQHTHPLSEQGLKARE